MNTNMTTNDRRGFALPAAIGALVIIGVLITAGFYMSQQELRIGVASKHANMAVNIAQAGANEVMGNWNGYRLGNIAVWSDTVLTDTIANGIWTVSIANANNYLYFLTATGEVTEGGLLWAGAKRTIGITTKVLFANINPPAALTTRGKVKVGGTSDIIGTDYTSPAWASYCATLPQTDTTGVLVDDASGGNPTVDGGGSIVGSPASAEDSTIVDSTFTNFGEMDWAELTALAQAEGKNVTGLGPTINGIAPSLIGGDCNETDLLNWGDTVPTNPCGAYFPLIYHGGDVSLQSASFGQGLLLVEGDLELRGGFTFMGIIITQGSFTTGVGNNRVLGAVMASNATDLNQTFSGTGMIQYSRCAVTRAILNNASLSRVRPTERRSWVDLTAVAN